MYLEFKLQIFYLESDYSIFSLVSNLTHRNEDRLWRNLRKCLLTDWFIKLKSGCWCFEKSRIFFILMFFVPFYRDLYILLFKKFTTYIMDFFAQILKTRQLPALQIFFTFGALEVYFLLRRSKFWFFRCTEYFWLESSASLFKVSAIS